MPEDNSGYKKLEGKMQGMRNQVTPILLNAIILSLNALVKTILPLSSKGFQLTSKNKHVSTQLE